MFDNLSQRLQVTLKRLRGQGRLTEENTREALREVRLALLEADVALPVVKDFIEHVRVRAAGQEVLASLTPGQALIKVVHDELVTLMGAANERLNLATRPPAVILVAGLQGSGKTTTVAKLARLLREREKKSVMVVSADVYPPGAGRGALEPVETLFVVDSMTGQDAVNTAKAFNEALPLTGVILTKTDGDARGGAALSIRQVTGKPITFMGVGEKPAALEPFYPDRGAARILGMGDVLGLVEQASQATDQEKAQEFARKVAKGKGFDLEDFRDQMLQMEKMGGLASLMEKLPGAGEVSEAAKSQLGDRQVRRAGGIINSMT